MDCDQIEFRFRFQEDAEQESTKEGTCESRNLVKNWEADCGPQGEDLVGDTGAARLVKIGSKEAPTCTELLRFGSFNIRKFRTPCDKDEASDLVPGRYEGGRKLWESSLDLARFVFECEDTTSAMKGARILELGCGHGIPGIAGILAGGSSIDFQDFNEDVLREITANNVAANAVHANWHASTRYFAGDWEKLVPLMKQEPKYDVILTAETIYALQNQNKLCALIEACLCPQQGIALVAAKTYYFGVGGGTRQFEGVVRSRGNLTSKVVQVVEDGASNKREILLLQHGRKHPEANRMESI